MNNRRKNKKRLSMIIMILLFACLLLAISLLVLSHLNSTGKTAASTFVITYQPDENNAESENDLEIIRQRAALLGDGMSVESPGENTLRITVDTDFCGFGSLHELKSFLFLKEITTEFLVGGWKGSSVYPKDGLQELTFYTDETGSYLQFQLTEEMEQKIQEVKEKLQPEDATDFILLLWCYSNDNKSSWGLETNYNMEQESDGTYRCKVDKSEKDLFEKYIACYNLGPLSQTGTFTISTEINWIDPETPAEANETGQTAKSNSPKNNASSPVTYPVGKNQISLSEDPAEFPENYTCLYYANEGNRHTLQQELNCIENLEIRLDSFAVPYAIGSAPADMIAIAVPNDPAIIQMADCLCRSVSLKLYYGPNYEYIDTQDLMIRNDSISFILSEKETEAIRQYLQENPEEPLILKINCSEETEVSRVTRTAEELTPIITMNEYPRDKPWILDFIQAEIQTSDLSELFDDGSLSYCD